MQKSCQKIVRVQNGLITEIYDGLIYRHFNNNESAYKELLLDDVGLEFDAILEIYEKLIYDLAVSSSELRSFILKRLPEGWLEWAQELYSEMQPEEAPVLQTTRSIL
ncbi:hypothetical protein [Paenibacillus cremeus]|uniref:Uncharacterized protein n=1 Tax=Paenibacillus cremeus TaxID=2163881 RepID=A0A559KHB8_9BACL|nr:hypothetical protein [Paenibacillus cremeus]TVY11522.1 hypothetical protein FPZ49_02135 [Paenibacillus cremeus]